MQLLALGHDPWRGRGAQPASIVGQDVRLFAGLLDRGEAIEHELPAGRCGWVHVARGRLLLNGQALGPGDGAAIRDARRLSLDGAEAAEIVLWDLPAE